MSTGCLRPVCLLACPSFSFRVSNDDVVLVLRTLVPLPSPSSPCRFPSLDRAEKSRVEVTCGDHTVPLVLVSPTSHRSSSNYTTATRRRVRPSRDTTTTLTDITHASRLTDRSRLASAPHLRLFIALPHPAPRAYPPNQTLPAFVRRNRCASGVALATSVARPREREIRHRYIIQFFSILIQLALTCSL